MENIVAPAILGTGFAVPDRVVGNDDPVYDYIRANQPPGMNLFEGYEHRRFLGASEEIHDLVTTAALNALNAAGITADAIDRLYGFVSVSLASTPNDIGLLHRFLKLRSNARVLAINTEFTNFVDALEMAVDAYAAGRCQYALLAFGCNWSRYVDYRSAPALSASDGAGAVVIGPRSNPTQFQLVDSEALVGSQYFGTMKMAPETPAGQSLLHTHPYFQILEGGQAGFVDFAIPSVPHVTKALLKRHGLSGADITLITHQASSVMMNKWQTDIEPRYYASTLREYANTTLASLPITFAKRYDEIPTDWVVLCGVGHYFHTTAVLLRRATFPPA